MPGIKLSESLRSVCLIAMLKKQGKAARPLHERNYAHARENDERIRVYDSSPRKRFRVRAFNGGFSRDSYCIIRISTRSDF